MADSAAMQFRDWNRGQGGVWSELGGEEVGWGRAGTRRAVIPGSVLKGRSGGRWTVHWGRCFLPGGARSCLGGDRPEPGGARRGGGGAGTREVSRGWQWPPRLRSGGERGRRGLGLRDREVGQGRRLQADPARWGPGAVGGGQAEGGVGVLGGP